MSIILFIVVLIVTYVVGVFGFSQIVGSLQNFSSRGAGLSLLTIVLWGAILVGSFFLMKNLVPDQSVAYYIGMVASLVSVLSSGKIQ